MHRPPHLPFLDGPAAFRVGLAPIAQEAWLAPDWEAHALAAKRALLDRRLGEVHGALPGSALAAGEAARLVGPETLIEAARLVSDDLVVLERQAGEWVVTTLVLCAPTFFSAAEVLGRSLHGLHAPVPAAAPEFAGRIARVFDGLRPELILERWNWTVQPGAERFTPVAEPVFAPAATLAPHALAPLLHLRLERQTIRRLPQTGGVLFTIRVSLLSLGSLLAEPAVRAAFAAAWAGTPPPVRDYKRWGLLEEAVAVLLAGL